MADIGLYAVTRIAAAIAGATASLPGTSEIPAVARVDVGASGYEFALRGAGGEDYGRATSARPLKVELSRLPDHFINAVLAAEDRRFLEHPGVDPVGTAAAALDTLRGRTRGGSGLAQQMVKNTMVGAEVSFSRKAVEAMLAVRSIERFGQKEVLRRYLQSAWFGRGRTGVMAAPAVWFGKEWSQITPAESAALAALLKGPAQYDPWRFPERSKSRRDAILRAMLSEGWIDQATADEALAENVRAIAPPDETGTDPWALAAARRELGGLSLAGTGSATLTVDPRWQEIATSSLSEAVREMSGVKAPPRLTDTERALLEAADQNAPLPSSLRHHLPLGSAYSSFALLGRNDAGWTVTGPEGRIEDVPIRDPHPDWAPAQGDIVTGYLDDEGILRVRLKTEIEGAVVAIDPRDGAIIATVGGVDANLTWFDRTVAVRSPGSTIKPFVYLAALDMGFSPQNALQDREKTYRSGGQNWRPRNYDRRQLGSVPMHTALERSLNMATVWLAHQIGIEAVARTAEAAGVYPEGGMVRVLPAAIGASDTTLADLVGGFAAIMNDGMRRPRHVIGEVDRDGGEGYRSDAETGTAIASLGAVNDLLGMLRGVVTRGTARIAMKDVPVIVGGKTGTSQDHKDAWFISVSPHLALGVWLGRDDSKPLPGRTTGGAQAAPVAARIYREAHEAGLIDSEGYRDERRDARTPWPPDAHANLSREVPTGSVSLEWGDDAAEPEESTGWQEPEAGSWDGMPEDRNGDLLQMVR